MKQIIIHTERLTLREYEESDFDAVYAMISDPVTMSHYPKPYDERGARRWIEWSIHNYAATGLGWWAIELCDTGEFIGDCGITPQEIDGETLPELGYHIDKRFWRHGYGKEAATAVVDYVFTNTDYPVLYSYTTVDNVASVRLAESVGMKKIKEFSDDHYGKMIVCAITKDEWQTIRKENK